jgi:bifunctional DNase/RNase
MAIEVQVVALMQEEEGKSAVVVLRAVEGEETLPIQIGFAEASAIAVALHGVKFERPMTHDLLLSVLESLGGHLEKVEVTDLRDGTFYGLLFVRKGRGVIKIDTRPSDAIALALRAKAPIYVAEEVFRKVEPHDITEASRKHWLNFLQALEGLGEKNEEID